MKIEATFHIHSKYGIDYPVVIIKSGDVSLAVSPVYSQKIELAVSKEELVWMAKGQSGYSNFDYAVPDINLFVQTNGLVVWDYGDDGVFGKALYLGDVLHRMKGAVDALSVHPYA